MHETICIVLPVCICSLFRVTNDHTNNLFYEYRILKFNDIVELKTILFMFDAYHNVLPYDLQQLFIKSIPLYSARRIH